MLEVLIDKYGIRKKGKEVLTSPNQYARSWNEIIEFINNETKETIILRTPSLKIYFQNLRNKFRNKIKIYQISPRYEWKNLMGFKLPFDIDDGKIAELLLSEDIEKLKEMENKKLATLCILTETTDFSDFTVEYSLMECILKDAEHNYQQLLNDIIDEIIKSLPVGRRLATVKRGKEQKRNSFRHNEVPYSKGLSS